jgi:alpha-methylacyl-CoA racemase
MALAGIKVLELEGIGPGPLAACVLADFGADVITISRVVKGRVASQADPVSRGKRSIALDLKSADGVATLKKMVKQADVFIEPFRPGAVEKLGIGPDVLCAENPRLIYGRMTGFGQGGTKFEKMAGHDANYLALAGTLDLFRRGDERPLPPANFAGDYAGGGMMLAMGVLIAVIERATSDKGQVIDAAMVDGANYVALPLYKWMQVKRCTRFLHT